jgi:cytochrome b561
VLYVLMIVMPIAGYIRVKAGGFPIETLDAMGFPSLVARSDAVADVAKGVHYFGAFAITAVVIVHVSAGVYHGVIRRDGVFSRIWPPVARRRR